MNEVQRGLRQQELRQETVSRYQQFQKGRDDALFHATLATGEGLAANVRATRDKTRQALALWNVAFDTRTPLMLYAPFAGCEKDEVLAGCYELLLVLADALAHPLPGEDPDRQREAALRILERAS